MKRWSTREVARLAGVSPATVSRVLNHRTSVAPDLADRVHGVIQTLENGAGISRRPARKVLVAFPQRLEGHESDPVSGAFYGQVLRGIDEVLRQEGHELSIQPYDPAGDPVTLIGHQFRCDGLILMGADTPDELAREAGRRNLPVIVVDKQVRGVDSVVSDNVGGAEEVTAHALEAGYRHLAYLCETFSDPSFEARRQGFLRAVESSGLAGLQVRTVEVGRGWLGAPAALDQLLEAAAFPLAVVSGNDMTALHILGLARAKGISVPDQIGLTGFDDVNLASRSDPPLTTVRVDKVEMGRLAVRRLMDRMAEPDLLPITITMHVALLVRGSTKLSDSRLR